MKLFLLDAAGPEILFLVPIAFILFLFVWGLVEGFVIYLFKINKFWRSIWHAMLINLASVVVGFIIMNTTNGTAVEQYLEIDEGPDYLSGWAIYWVVSVLVEGLLLKALNRNDSWGKIFGASLVMNIITYIIMYSYINYFQ